jgi:hypothetical protein
MGGLGLRMFAGSHIAAPDPSAAIAYVARLMATLLCLASIAVLAVALRFALYDYFHGSGRLLKGLSDLL